MGRKADYLHQLQSLGPGAWEPFLKSESGLPGPRGNLELAAAYIELAPRDQILRFAALEEPDAPGDSPEGFLAFCGVFGLGRLVVEGESQWLKLLRARAHDPRWRLREAVAMALQAIGDWSMDHLLEAVEGWREDGYERRAAIAGLCEPRLLKHPEEAARVFDHLNEATGWIGSGAPAGDQAVKVLTKGLAYAWSVAVSAFPEAGKPAMQRWFGDPSPLVRRIMKENLSKARLSRMDADWVARAQAQLNQPPHPG
jgi:hypothetical protein